MVVTRNDVRRFYALTARGYDLFKHVWNGTVASKAERDLTVFLKDNLNTNKSVLELGCGTATNLETIRSLNLKFMRYLCLDFSPDMLKIARSKFPDNRIIEFREKDITNVEDLKERFDIIICTWVLSHLDSPSSLVNNAQRFLKKDGKLFIMFITKPQWYINLGIYLPVRYIFKVKYISAEEIQKMINVRSKRSYFANLVTVIEIEK